MWAVFEYCPLLLYIKRRNFMKINSIVPLWRKYTLSIEEAAEYFRIGINKLRNLANENKDADWILWNSNRAQIKRKKFEDFIDSVNYI